MIIRPILPDDDLSKFRCGNNKLDHWLRTHARDNQHRFGTTHVAVKDGEIIGYVTVAASSIARERLGASGPTSWPVLRLARLAVTKGLQRGGIGEQLMAHVFQLAANQHEATGCAAVVVDAKPEAGDGGVDADQVAKTAGLKGSKGSAPLLRTIAALLGDKRAVARPRAGADGKKRWVLTPKGMKTAAKLGLIQQN